MPNLQAKLQAARLMDEVDGDVAVERKQSKPKERPTDQPAIQQDGMVMVGNDVELLFPSLRDVEAARMARLALIKSKLDVDGFDCKICSPKVP